MVVAEYSPNEVKGAVAGVRRRRQGTGAEDGPDAAGPRRTTAAARRGRCRGGRADPRRAPRRRGGGAHPRIRRCSMIGSLRGTLLEREDGELLVEVGGVGYRVAGDPGDRARGRRGVARRGLPARPPPPPRGRRGALRLPVDRGPSGVRDVDRHPRRGPRTRPRDPVGALTARASPRARYRRRRSAVPGAGRGSQDRSAAAGGAEVPPVAARGRRRRGVRRGRMPATRAPIRRSPCAPTCARRWAGSATATDEIGRVLADLPEQARRPSSCARPSSVWRWPDGTRRAAATRRGGRGPRRRGLDR